MDGNIKGVTGRHGWEVMGKKVFQLASGCGERQHGSSGTQSNSQQVELVVERGAWALCGGR